MKKIIRSIQISCDGGAATGKSTGAKMLSKKYNLKFLSSGLLYRYAAFLILRYKPKNITSYLKRKFKNLDYKKLEKLKLHTPEISNYSSIIAKNASIRVVLKKFQINFSKRFSNCCIEGRDISTKILPNSDLKFFFYCSLKIAAMRRYKELKKINKRISLNEVLKSIKNRDKSDYNRKISPLKKTKDSLLINTTNLNKSACFLKIKKIIDRKLKINGNL